MLLNGVRERLEQAFAERSRSSTAPTSSAASPRSASTSRSRATSCRSATCTRSRRCAGRSRTRSSASATRSATTARSRRSHYNFDQLAFPPRHPARSPRATFFFDDGDVLRTETSPSQIHELEERRPPIYMVSIGRCYRRDAIDATHYPIFHQFEGLAVDKGLTLADLKGTLLHVMRALYGPERRVRFRTHYFPFTEPSIEPDVSCGICGGSGCRTCKYSGWLEMGGAGMVDPQVLANVGARPRGVERLRVRLRARARRPAAPRLPGHPRPLGGRPPRPEAVLMRVPLSWLREYVRSTMPLDELAERLEHRLRRGEGDRAPRRRRRRRQPRPVPRRPRARGRQAPERRPPPALPGRRRRGRAAPDRLRRVELRRRRDRRAWRCPARVLPNGLKLERREGARRGLRRDDPVRGRGRLGTDHSGIMVLPASRARRRRSPTCCRSPRRSCESSRPATAPDLLSVYGLAREVARALRRSSSHRRPAVTPRGSATSRSTSRSRTTRAARATSGGCSATCRSGRRRRGCGRALNAAGHAPDLERRRHHQLRDARASATRCTRSTTNARGGRDRRPPRRPGRAAAHARRRRPRARCPTTC